MASHIVYTAETGLPKTTYVYPDKTQPVFLPDKRTLMTKIILESCDTEDIYTQIKVCEAPSPALRNLRLTSDTFQTLVRKAFELFDSNILNLMVGEQPYTSESDEHSTSGVIVNHFMNTVYN